MRRHRTYNANACYADTAKNGKYKYLHKSFKIHLPHDKFNLINKVLSKTIAPV